MSAEEIKRLPEPLVNRIYGLFFADEAGGRRPRSRRRRQATDDARAVLRVTLADVLKLRQVDDTRDVPRNAGMDSVSGRWCSATRLERNYSSRSNLSG